MVNPADNLGDSLSDVDAARRRVAGQVAAAQARRDETRRLADDIRALSATARSPQGEVRVTAAPGGRVLAVEIIDAGVALDARTLSTIVTRTIAESQRLAAQAAVEHTASVLGADSPLVARLRADVDAHGGGDSTTITYR